MEHADLPTSNEGDSPIAPDEIVASASDAQPAPQTPRRGCGCGCLGCAFQALGLLALVAILLTAGAGWWFWHWAHRDASAPGAAKTLEVEIREGDSLRTIAHKLERAGVAEPWPCVVALAAWQRVDRRLKTGRYAFAPGEAPTAVLARMTLSGETPSVRVTLPEGWTLAQMAQRLEARGVIAEAERFLTLGRDVDFLRSIGIPLDSAEGFLFPDTYLFEPGAGEAVVLRRLAARLRAVALSPEELGLLPGVNSPNAHPLSYAESVTLASIVEREARDAGEMGLIASVYHNRLRGKKRLQSCATVRYALDKWDAALTLEDLKVDSPYNTYKCNALPPGPICNPGREALEAAFRPEKSKFLYYVYKGDGKHAFSRTLTEHNRAKRRYKDAWTFSGSGSDSEMKAE